MKFKNLGNTDISISAVGAGTWAIGGTWWSGTDVEESVATIKASIENGINFIDTAPAYGNGLSEEIIGKAIKGQRDKVVLATKCGLIWDREEGHFHFELEGTKIYRCLTCSSIKDELEISLRLLDTDYIDLYITHWQDPTTPVEETMSTLLELKDEGKIRAIGVSNATVADMEQYIKFGKLDADQEKYNLLERDAENENIPWCQKNNATFIAYSAIAQGLLTGTIDPEKTYDKNDIRSMNPLYEKDTVIKINEMLKKHYVPMADKYGCSLAQLAIAAVISMDNVVALCGARNRDEAIENARSADIKIEKDDLDVLRDAADNIVAAKPGN
jgi:methylglyoxal reductase